MRITVAGKGLEVRHVTRPAQAALYPGGPPLDAGATWDDMTRVETRLEYRGQWVARAWSGRRGKALWLHVESNPKAFKRAGLPYRRTRVVRDLDGDHPKQRARLVYQLDIGPRAVLLILRDILRLWGEELGFRPTHIDTGRATGIRGGGVSITPTTIPLRGLQRDRVRP